MEKTPNSNAPTLKLINGPAGRDKREEKGKVFLRKFIDSMRAKKNLSFFFVPLAA